MIHPHTELRFIDDEVGFGVVASRRIPKGTITWSIDRLDRELDAATVESLEPTYREFLDTYTYRNRRGNYVLCWDHGRFVNHSFRSNCVTTAYEFELAIRDIEPGEQLTDDYGFLNILEPFHPRDEGTERTVVFPDDLLTYHEHWDRLLLEAFPLVPEVEQPLMPVLSPEHRDVARSVATGRSEMDSILNCHFPGAVR